ncbi:MAG TPA: BrnT family toxin, partial [Gemmatimonadota bacterium]|nr:BrnT family toxin [Gemmatimonadota bacterium]
MGTPIIRWDADKAEENRIRHRVDFLEATDVLLDPLAVTIQDDTYSIPGEHCVTIVGMSRRGRLLRVTVEDRGLDHHAPGRDPRGVGPEPAGC